MTSGARRLRLLVLSWNYPTQAAPQRGLWVERMCSVAAEAADVSVIVPTPWVPPGVPIEAISRFRRVPAAERRGDVTVYCPRVPGSFEYLTHAMDSTWAAPAVSRLAHRLHASKPFDLIHAHFIYPDGVLASRLGRALDVPVMTSEHAFWVPWLNDQPREAAQVDAALPGIRLVAPVSAFLKNSIDEYARGRVRTVILPNVVDDRVFTPSPRVRDENEVLYVGLVRAFKRVDVLLRAIAIVRRTRPGVRLRILSANAFRAYRKERREMRELTASLGLDSVVQVINGSDPPAVAEAMRRCAMVAVSSTRRETFCAVAAEALACGTPLAITRCGGPEEFVTSADGVMVEPDDPAAMAEAILRVFADRARYDPAGLSGRIVRRFGRAAWGAQVRALYGEIVGRDLGA